MIYAQCFHSIFCNVALTYGFLSNNQVIFHTKYPYVWKQFMPGRIEHKNYIQLDILIQRDNGFRNKSYKSSNILYVYM
jgi:hypothetical protein